MPLFGASENEFFDDEGFSVVFVTNKKDLKRKSQKHKSYPNSFRVKFRKKGSYFPATFLLRSVILQSNFGDKGGKSLVSYNPITIDRCLGEAIGQYEFCKPFRTTICE